MRFMGYRASRLDTETIKWMLDKRTDPQGVRLSEEQLRELQKTLERRQKDEAE